MSILEAAVADMLIKATSAAEAAGKFAMEQLPDIAQQYVLYVGITRSVTFLACVGFLIAGLFLTYKIHKWIWEEKVHYVQQRDIAYAPLFFGWLIFGGIVGVTAVSSFNQAILAFLAPKVLLIQWAAQLVK